MIYFQIIISILYLLFQKVIHLQVPIKYIFRIDIFTIFYFLLLIIIISLIISNVIFKLSGKRKLPNYLKLLGYIEWLLIICVELLRFIKPETFSKIYFNGYPIDKIIIAAFYSIILFLIIYSLLAIATTLFTGKKKTLKLLFYEVTLLTILIFSAFIKSTSYNENFSIYSGEKEFDYVVILGAAVVHKNQPSNILKHRILKALEIYRRGLAKKIICTGGNAPNETSEASVEKKILLQHGVSPKNIISEQKTSTTLEQIVFLKKFFKQNESAIIVSDFFHLERVKSMCEFMRLNAETVSTGLKISSNNLLHYKLRDSVALLLFILFGI